MAAAAYALRQPVTAWARRVGLLRVVLTVVVGIVVVLPIVRLVIGSFHAGGPVEGSGPLTLSNYDGVIRGDTLTLLKNTLIFSVGQTLIPLVIGVLLAWVVTRTDTPLRRVWEIGAIALYFIPFLAGGTAWIILLGPSSGIVTTVVDDLFGIHLSIYSMPGMIIVQSVYLIPLVFLIVGAAFRSINPELEEAARLAGSSVWRTFMGITLGVARPAVLSAALLCFIIGIGSFDIPLLLGLPDRIYLFTNQIFASLTEPFPPNYGQASALSMVLLVIGLILLWSYTRTTRNAHRYMTIGGRTGAAEPIPLGRTRWLVFALCLLFFACAELLPFLAVVLGSLLPFIGIPSWSMFSHLTLGAYSNVFSNEVFWRALRNSLLLSACAGVVVMVIGGLIAYSTARFRSRWSRAIEIAASAPLTLPPTILAFGLLLTFITFELPGGFAIYGTLWIIGLSYVAYFLPIAVRQMSGAVLQVSEDLEHASRVAGGTRAGTMLRIVVPLLMPALWGGFLLAFITYMREFANSILLVTTGNETLSVEMYRYYTNGGMPEVAVIAVILSVIPLALVWAAGRFFKIRISF